MSNFIALAVNYGVTHFVSFGDVLMRGIFLPAMLIFCIWGFIKVTQDIKSIDLDEPFEEEKAEMQEAEQTMETKAERPEIKVITNTNNVA